MKNPSTPTEYIFNKLKKHKKELYFVIFLSTLASILAVGIPFIYGKLFDKALIPNTPISFLLSLIVIWFILGLVSGFVSNKSSLYGEIIGIKVSLETEAEAYSHYLTLPISFHKRKRKGEILNKISRGAENLIWLTINISDVFPSFLMLILSLIIMMFIQWQLALIIIFFFIIYSILTIKLVHPILKSEDRLHKLFEKQYGSVYDKLYNVFLVKNFAMEEKEKERIFNSIVEKIVPQSRKNAEIWKRLGFWQGVIYNVTFVVVLSTAIFFLRNGSITSGEFIMFFGYINLSFAPFWKLSEIYRLLKKSSVGIKRILKLQALLPEAMNHGDKILEDAKGGIEFENISFSYVKDKKVLENINLKINAGETVALVGESGVGKTTLSELIIGYYQPLKGRIFFDGVDVSELSLKWMREQIAIVPQDISVLNDTLLNNLKYANPDAKFVDIIKSAKAAHAHDFIMKLPKKYNTLVGERGVKLSMGQKQRLALTMAFLKNPKILILDEPTSALDAESEVRVREGMKNLIKGRTTIIIAHRFSTVRNADKIIVLEKGKIIEVGKHNELIRKRGRYYRLYTFQIGLD